MMRESRQKKSPKTSDDDGSDDIADSSFFTIHEGGPTLDIDTNEMDS